MSSFASAPVVPVEVVVQLKQEVLDPEARAIQDTLGRLGYSALRGVTVTRRYILAIDEAAAAKSATEVAADIAREVLANPVSETFAVKKL